MPLAASADERAIRELVATWMAASIRGDHKTILSLVADDAVFLVPGQEPFGKAAFAAALEAMRGGRLDAKSSIQEIQILGDWAYIRNHLQVTFKLANEAVSMRRAGHTLTILRKTSAGRWQIARDANLLMPDA